MSFYMTHMFGVIIIQQVQVAVFAATDVSSCSEYQLLPRLVSPTPHHTSEHAYVSGISHTIYNGYRSTPMLCTVA